MTEALHLTISTPMEILVDASVIASIRAEDASGSFGVLPGHTDFLTVLRPSVLRWVDTGGRMRFCALRSGLLTVRGGTRVAVACREGVLGDDLEALRQRVRDMRRDEADEDRRSRVEHMRLHAQAVRQMMRFLRPGRSGALDHPPRPKAAADGGADEW